MVLSRRQILKLGAGALATGIAGAEFARGGAAKTTARIPIGLELWSVRHQCETELPTVLRAVARMGYEAVELAHSYYGHDASAWRKLLDENGLKSCGMHMGLRMLEGDAFDETVRIHKLIGTPYLIVASLPKKNLASVEAIVETAKYFNTLSERLAPHGMKIGYHCHGGDFAEVGGRTAWEVFGQNTKADVLLQLDIGNCLGGGGDPIAMLKEFPGRSVSIHLKDHGGKPGAVFGEGEVNWPEVFQLCETIGGTRQYIIEEEGRKGPEALEAVRRALENFRKMVQ
jgi:sugar phosphate isomerase/epimerase